MTQKSMDNQVIITPTVDQTGAVVLCLTADQFDEVNRALISYNKRREVNRIQAAKRRGNHDSKSCKPTLIFSYPVAEVPIVIQNRTTYNTTKGTARTSHVAPILPPSPTQNSVPIIPVLVPPIQNASVSIVGTDTLGRNMVVARDHNKTTLTRLPLGQVAI